ncbi:MAG TPA: protein phosphatase 2C domain-containing protein [Anaerolineae bacterium]|nr:protein phosphatase 2C domain-containing protein [Anaerolineae bacterium]
MSNQAEQNEAVQPRLYFHYAGKTDTGIVRDHNEDAFILPIETGLSNLETQGYLYIVADGMGGHQKGEVASNTTIDAVSAAYYAKIQPLPTNDPEKTIINTLADAIQEANFKVLEATQGGGTTIVAAVLYDNLLVIMNVGDSRAYLLRHGELQLLSRDPSLVSRLVEMGRISPEEALTHPRRNVLYQALGQGGDLEIHTAIVEIELDDIIILCSDGLWGEISESAIQDVLLEVSNPAAALQRLIELANESGGLDNITAVIITVSDQEPPPDGYSEYRSPTQRTAVDDTRPSIAVMTKDDDDDALSEWQDE